MLKVTCALIVNNDNLLITQLGVDSAHPYLWEFPGGKVKNGESHEDCIKREIREELDIQVEIITKLTPVVHDYGFRKVKLIPFLCTVISGKISLNAHVDLKWMKLNQLKDFDLVRADKKLIEIEENNLRLKEYFREKMDYSGQDRGPSNN